MAENSDDICQAPASGPACRGVPRSWLVRRVEAQTARSEFQLERITQSLGERAFLDGMEPGDELWFYCSPPKTWEQLCGRTGFAIVRGGQVIEHCLLATK